MRKPSDGSRLKQLAVGAIALIVTLVTMPVLAQQPQELVVATFGGELGKHIKAVYEPFEKQYNVKIKWSEGEGAANVARALATKDHPEFDVVFGDNLSHALGSEHNLWSQIDQRIVTNYQDQYPLAKSAGNDVIDFGFVSSGIFYAADEFQKQKWTPPAHWVDLFNPQVCGRVGMPTAYAPYTDVLLLMLAGGDPNKVDASIAKIASAKKCIPTLEPTAAKLEENMLIGNYLIGLSGSVRVAPLIKRGAPLKFVVPSDGVVMLASTAAVAKNSPRQQLAQEFCNWLLRPDVQVQLMNTAFYGPTNIKVTVPQEMIALGVPGPAQVSRAVRVPDRVIADNRQKWQRALERAMAN